MDALINFLVWGVCRQMGPKMEEKNAELFLECARLTCITEPEGAVVWSMTTTVNKTGMATQGSFWL